MLPKQMKDSILAFIFINLNSKDLYLPPEIIEYIYSFILREHYGNKISKFYSNNISVRKSLKYIIENASIFINSYNVIAFENIQALQILINSYIPRKYNLHFWSCYLQILSHKINQLRFYHKCNNIGFKSPAGKRFRYVLDLWLHLCKRFNFKIYCVEMFTIILTFLLVMGEI